jgi:hypothetical protein
MAAGSQEREDDVVLLRDVPQHRNDLPMGIVVKAYLSDDKVRKVDVRTAVDRKIYTRPVSDVVILLSE